MPHCSWPPRVRVWVEKRDSRVRMTAGIRVEDLTKTYRGGTVRALDRVSVAIEPGEVFGIIGPNGAGKTTLLGCLLGFLRPDSGRVSIDGREPDDLAIRNRTGYLPERLVMDRWMTGRDFLSYHHGLARLPRANRFDDVSAVLAKVALDEDAAGKPIRKYSRGMLQRIGLAQALLGEPRYVFLDEPASGVDPAGVILFRRLIADLEPRGVTVVLNSHQLEQVERVCDRVAFVSRGRVEAIETMRAGAAIARVLRVRWTAAATIDRARLERAAGQVGATLQNAAEHEARFEVASDEQCARLLAALVAEGIPVIEASPEESRLERLFTAPGAGAGAAPSAPAATWGEGTPAPEAST
jgi:ABC-2 type transport system ATP-binding protein